MQTRRRTNEERRIQSIEAVSTAALDLFVRKGYAGTSIDEIAARAKLTKGSVYHYFSDKQDLLMTLLDRSERTLFEPAFIKIRASDSDAVSQLVMFINWVAREGAANKELMLLPVLASLEFFGFGNDAQRRVEQMYGRQTAEIERIMKLGQKQGFFSKDAAARTMAISVISFIDGLLLQWYRWGKDIDGPALARQARSMVLEGICAKP